MPNKPPYDQYLANMASAVDQCVKLGGVILRPKRDKTGFDKQVPEPPRPPEPPRS